MALNTRLVPRLDIKGPNLVKGIRLEGLRVLGKPERFAAYYYEQGADELLFVDIVASLYGRNSLLDIIERVSKQVFVPLTVAGGIRSLDDIRSVLRAGADKVALNTAAVTVSRVTTTVTNDTARLVGTITEAATLAITESGVFNADTAGTMLCRQTFSAVNVLSGDSLQFTWSIACA